MSTLLEQINADFMTAFKNKEMDKKNVLGLLKSNITKKEQEKRQPKGGVTDDVVISVIKKSIKTVNETIAASGDNQEAIDEAKFEKTILEAYLPAQMSEDEIEAKVKELIDGGAENMGAIMKEFKGLPADMSLVSQKARQSLNQ